MKEDNMLRKVSKLLQDYGLSGMDHMTEDEKELVRSVWKDNFKSEDLPPPSEGVPF